MKKIVTLKEYKMMNGRQVPIYKVNWVSDKDYKKATEEAKNKLKEDDEKNQSVNPVAILKEFGENQIGIMGKIK